MEDRFQELAMLKLAGKASGKESSELEKLLSDNPDFRAEYEQLQKEIPAIKDLIPLVQTPETSDGEVPDYEKTAFLTEVGEIFGKPENVKAATKDSEESVPLLFATEMRSAPSDGAVKSNRNDDPRFSFFKLALSGLAVLALVIIINTSNNKQEPIAKTPEPVIQLAMLDIVGETRGEEDDKIKSLKEAWPKTQLETHSEIDPAKAWRDQWGDDSKAPQVKILYDVTEGEITVQGRWKGESKTETLPVDDNLSEVLDQAKELVKQWYSNK